MQDSTIWQSDGPARPSERRARLRRAAFEFLREWSERFE